MEETQKAYIYAVRALTRRDHSEAELRRKMVCREFSSQAVDDAVNRLKRCGYLDDKKFAIRWAESAVRNGKGYGARLRFELSRRGIDEHTAAEAAEQMRSEFDETETIRLMLVRKFAGFLPQSSDDRQKRRILGYFQRRGFSLSAILEVFREMEER